MCTIDLEDLKGIRSRVTVRCKQKSKHSNWSFFQLRNFIEYKAKRAGAPVILVDPKNIRHTCPVCGCIDKANCKTQVFFFCVSCGYSAPADTIVARNIRAGAVVNLPMVSNPMGSGTSCRPKPTVVN